MTSNNKSILITGCSTGIGYCVAKGLQERGYRVFATARRVESVEALNNEGLESLQLDLDDSESIRTQCNGRMASFLKLLLVLDSSLSKNDIQRAILMKASRIMALKMNDGIFFHIIERSLKSYFNWLPQLRASQHQFPPVDQLLFQRAWRGASDLQ